MIEAINLSVVSGKALEVIEDGLENYVKVLQAKGIISFGGSMQAFIVASLHQLLPGGHTPLINHPG